jgi:crotonobetaine/carnitine-CoA ligase
MDIIGNRTWLRSFAHLAIADPGAPAIEHEHGGSLTRGEVAGHAAAVAEKLAAFGVGAGDRVGLHLDNSVAYSAIVVAVAALGAVASPISTKLTDVEVGNQIEATGLRLLLTNDEAWIAKGEALGLPTAAEADLVPALTPVPATGDAFAHAILSRTADVDAPAVIICTSGSTAAPKPIVLSHGNVMAAVVACQEYYGIGPADVGFTVFPWCHANGHINQLISWLALGAKIVVAAAFSASRFSDQLRRFQPTVVFLNGTHIKMVLAKLPAGAQPGASPLRVIPTALELDDATAAEFRRMFGGLLRKVYYQTETCAPVLLCDLTHRREGAPNDNPLGHPSPGHLVRLVDPDGRPVAPGEPGEILVRGLSRHSISLGHLDAETGELVEHDRTGWWATGDRATADADGFLYYAGRTKDMVKRAGHNVALAEVEAALAEHAAVMEVTTIGAPDPMREEMIIAFVARAADVTEAELLRHCEQRLAGYKVPSEVRWVDAVPRTELGKVDKAALRDLVAEGAR